MSILDNIFPNGLGESSGDDLVTSDPLYTDGDVFYVSSVLGDDSNAGTERLQPKATIGSAYTSAADGDIIVLAADHDETLTAALLVNKRLTVTGAGNSAGQPTAILRINTAVNDWLLDIAQPQVEIRNILFPTCVQSSTGARVKFGGEGAAYDGLVKGCKFEFTELDQGAGLEITNADHVRAVNCTFVITSAAATPPNYAIEVTDTAVTGFGIEDCVIDGGTMGFNDGIAIETSASNITGLRVEGTTLLRGSDIKVGSSTVGRINVSATGSGRVFVG